MATLREILVRVRADTASLTSGLAGAEKQLSTFGSRMQATGRRMQTAGRTLTRSVTFPIVGIGAASVKAALDVEKSFTQIDTLVGATASQMQTYHRGVADISRLTAKSQAELADALYFVTSSGFQGSKALDVLEASAKASAAGLGETMTVADAVTSAVNAFGPAMLSADDATNVLLATVREGKAEPAELAGAIGRVIPLAAELGVTFHDTGAALAGMSLSGLDAAESTTALRGIFTSLLKPTTDGEKVLKRLGTTATEVRDSLGERGLFETLMMLKEGLGDNREAMADLFPNVRALAGFLNLTGKNAKDNAAIFDELRGSVDDTSKAFDRARDSVGFKFAKAWNDLKNAGIELGRDLIPVLINDIIPAIRSMVRTWNGFSDSTKGWIIKALALAALAGPFIRLAGGLVQLAGGLAKVVPWLLKWAGIGRLPAIPPMPVGTVPVGRPGGGSPPLPAPPGGAAGPPGGLLGFPLFGAGGVRNVPFPPEVEASFDRYNAAVRQHGANSTQAAAAASALKQAMGALGEEAEDAATTIAGQDVANKQLAQRMRTTIATIQAYGGHVDALTRQQVSNLIAVGDEAGALELLKRRLDAVSRPWRIGVQVRVTGAAAVATLQSQLRSLPGNTGVEVHYGQIRPGAHAGGMTAGPTLAGEGRYATKYGTGAEWVLPAHSAGLRALRKELGGGMGDLRLISGRLELAGSEAFLRDGVVRVIDSGEADDPVDRALGRTAGARAGSGG